MRGPKPEKLAYHVSRGNCIWIRKKFWLMLRKTLQIDEIPSNTTDYLANTITRPQMLLYKPGFIAYRPYR